MLLLLQVLKYPPSALRFSLSAGRRRRVEGKQPSYTAHRVFGFFRSLRREAFTFCFFLPPQVDSNTVACARDCGECRDARERLSGVIGLEKDVQPVR